MLRTKSNAPYHADYELILSLIEPKSKVLDLGCGNGELLYRLIHERQVNGRGVDINEKNIIQCITKGLSVFQGNIDEGLAEYQDKSYDYVILNQTLQATHKPEFVIKEMLRVGKKAIVSFPNFAHWQLRAQLFFNGRMPKTSHLPFEWYDTVNIRFLTIRDFRVFCKQKDIHILQEIDMGYLGRNIIVRINPNLFAVEGLFIITER